MQTKPVILLVDDEPRNLRILEEILSDCDYELVSCSGGPAAWNWLQDPQHHVDAVLLDRMMPEMDGMEVVARVRCDQRLREVPVIFQTAMSDAKSIGEGIHAGAYYYLTKPYDFDVLRAIVAAAIEAGRNNRRLADAVLHANDPARLIAKAQFEFRSLEEAEQLAVFLAAGCPEPNVVVNGLLELLINAVEHGNLGISYQEKGELGAQGVYRDEIAKRLADPVHREKKVEVTMRREPRAIRFTIKDQGQGFDWQPYLDFDPERAFDTHGRGIAMARMLSFSSVEYRGNGNEVVALIDLTTPSTP